MRHLILPALLLLTACSAMPKLDDPATYITVSNTYWDAEHSAYLVYKGFRQCIGMGTYDIQKIGDDAWLVTHTAGNVALVETPLVLYAVEMDGHRAKVAAAYRNTGTDKNTGLFAEWIQVGKITTCQPLERHLQWWALQHPG